MLENLLAVISLTFCTFVAWRGLNFYQRYKQAQSLGFPIVICPVDPLDPFWLVSKNFLKPIIQRLPWALRSWLQYSRIGWSYPDFYATHARLQSDAFTIVTPGDLQIFVAEPEAAEDILKRYNDFIKSPQMYDMLNLLGPNVNTVNGKTWQRHRRITVPPFNERNSGLVWTESLRQSEEVLRSWTTSDKVTTTTSDSMTLALHVLIGAGFGMSYSFKDENHATPSAGHTMTYRDALRHIIRNMFMVVLLRLTDSLRLPIIILPSGMKATHAAMAELKSYFSEFVAQERQAIDDGKSAEEKANLISVLIRSAKQDDTVSSHLSDEEVYGNMFIYNVAGHDTTANTLSFAISLLAVYPPWQEWIQEELDQVLGEHDVHLARYEETFPKLRRCLAMMYETLRLYGPVVAIPRYTGEFPVHLSIANRPHTLPPHTYAYVNTLALHTHPKHWGTDPLSWRPSRWLSSENATSSPPRFLEPIPGLYNPWAGGPRICPGKKFSQVEFVAVLASLLQRHRVQAIPKAGETDQAARKRIMSVIEDARVQFTLKLPQPERITLRWVSRTSEPTKGL